VFIDVESLNKADIRLYALEYFYILMVFLKKRYTFLLIFCEKFSLF